MGIPGAPAMAAVRVIQNGAEQSRLGDSGSDSDRSSGGEEGGSYASRLAGSSFQVMGPPGRALGPLVSGNYKLGTDVGRPSQTAPGDASTFPSSVPCNCIHDTGLQDELHRRDPVS